MIRNYNQKQAVSVSIVQKKGEIDAVSSKGWELEREGGRGGRRDLEIYEVE